MSDAKKFILGMAGGRADTVNVAENVYGGMGNRTNKEGDNYAVHGGNVGQMGQGAQAERITVDGGAGNTAEDTAPMTSVEEPEEVRKAEETQKTPKIHKDPNNLC